MDVKQFIEDACNQYEQDKYAMYLRKSRTDLEMEALGEGETLARHLHMLEALAEKHGISMNQITVYKELVSGDSIQDRPEVQKLLADVHAKKYKGVLVVEVERLARGNTKDQGEVAEAFQISNTHIITPSKVYDPNNEFDQEYFEFGLFMSRREYKTIKRRMEAGKLQSVQEGNYILPQRVYGYDIVRKSKKERILVEKTDEAKIVRMVFDWFTEEGKSTGWIASQLTKMGIPTMRNRPEWNRGTINDILLNAHHMGKVVWGKQTVKKVYDENLGKLVKKRLPGNVQIYEGKHTGIISEEQFQKAQSIYESRKPKVKRDLRVVNPYSGLLVCSDCGGVMTYSDSAKAPSVHWNVEPRFVHPRREKCKKKSMTVSSVSCAIVESLKSYISDFEMKMENGNDQAELERHKEIIAAMEKELEKQESRKRKLMDSWESEDGMYTKDEFIERKQMYTVAIDNLKEQIQEAKKAAPAPVDYSERIVSLHAMIDCIQNPNISAKDKNVFLKKFIDKITYDVIDYGMRKGGKPILNVYLK